MHERKIEGIDTGPLYGIKIGDYVTLRWNCGCRDSRAITEITRPDGGLSISVCGLPDSLPILDAHAPYPGAPPAPPIDFVPSWEIDKRKAHVPTFSTSEQAR